MAYKSALGSRPEGSFEKKLVGIVSVVTGETKAKFTLQEEGKKFANGTDSLTVLLADLPSAPKLAKNDKSGKEYRIRTNAEKDAVEALTPVRGHFTAKLVDIGPRPDGEDSDPHQTERVYNEGTPKEDRHFEFFAVYEIVSGAFKGVRLPGYWLHYKFEEDSDNEGYTRFAGNFKNKQATRLFQLADWMKVHQLDKEALPWDDVSVLPELLDRALDSDLEVEVNIANGYIMKEGGVLPTDGYNEDAFGPGDVDEEFPEVKEDEPVKKNGKSAPKAEKKNVKAAPDPKTSAKKVPVHRKAEEDGDDL